MGSSTVVADHARDMQLSKFIRKTVDEGREMIRPEIHRAIHSILIGLYQLIVNGSAEQIASQQEYKAIISKTPEVISSDCNGALERFSQAENRNFSIVLIRSLNL